VDHVRRGEPVAPRDPGLPGHATAEPAAFLEQLGSRRAVDRAVDPAATQQALVRRVDDGVDGERRDVGLDDVDAVRHGAEFIT